VIVLPNGKNISPEELETEILKIEEIKEVVICEQDGKLTAKVYTEHDDKLIRQKINNTFSPLIEVTGNTAIKNDLQLDSFEIINHIIIL
jgi:long-subunit acyl-CoA synthetase (AMP-forming)